MHDTLAPTQERLSKSTWLKPTVDQKVRREAYKALDLWDRLRKSNELEGHQVDAARKLEKHALGVIGVDVRDTDAFTAELRDLDGIDPIIYHGQKLAEAKRVVPARQWHALMMVIQGESEDLGAIGGAICQIKNRPQARMAAVVLIQEGLTLLSRLWGFCTTPAENRR